MTRAEIVENDYDLAPSIYLRDYEYPAGVPLRCLDEVFNIEGGTVGAADSDDGEYPLVSSSEEWKRHVSWTHDAEAICIPLVSSTGHGHASLKRIHYVSGKFAAATIVAVLTPKPHAKVFVPYVYYYLLAHKDDLLVPLMRGATNKSISTDRLERLRIPLPPTATEQRRLVSKLVRGYERIESLKRDLSSATAQQRETLATLKSHF